MSSVNSHDDELYASRRSGSRSIKKIIETKVFEGDLRGAVRLLMSDDSFAPGDADTLASLKLKHPDPSRPLSFPPEPDPSITVLSVNVEDVLSALASFYSGSAAGLDGIRPGHLKELVSVSAGENGRRLVGCLTRLANFLLSGQLNPCVCPFLYGASLFALEKKDGGVRPIAVGSVFRRLTAKLACRAVKEDMARYLQPHQLGFGTRLGCEAAIHATRSFVMNPENEDSIVLKLDIRNAFNTLERDVLLSEVKEKIPSLYPFLHQDLEALVPRLRDLGLEVNPLKCEFFPCSTEARTHFSRFNSYLPGLRELSSSNFNLLGSPIFLSALPEAITSRTQLLLSAQVRLKDLSAHVAIILLRMCFALPKITYLMRTTPTWLCPEEVSSFDNALKLVVQSVLNVSLDEPQWRQAALPIRCGGLGVRCARDVGLPAFLASAHGVANLVTVLLGTNGDGGSMPFVSDAVSAWLSLSSGAAIPESKHVQRAWDDIGVKLLQEQLLGGAMGVDKARLRAVSQPESGAWLQAIPSPHLGTLLDDDSLRVAVALRLGCRVCEPHTCTCGSMVEADGHHALSCRRCTGRFPRHHALNDIIRRALVSANIPCVLEPPGLSRSDEVAFSPSTSFVLAVNEAMPSSTMSCQ
ncbi:hypothetical protein PYW08_004311 [Mythimna loreyi]|uniref:Uncharacterized protein n=1 Tax=Mythimna loreyi TaxID=667449 RepID=A0ACC2QQR5_9NEOP|nr:hypothetical protein PYW08_004311 [Mythimna loreyi]